MQHEIPVLPLLADLFLHCLLPLLYLLRNVILVLLHDPLDECFPTVINLLLVERVLVLFLLLDRVQVLIHLLPLVRQ